MTGDTGVRILMITPTDFSEMPNNVEHARIALYPAMGHSMTVLHLKLNRSRRKRDLLVDTLSWKVHRSSRDAVDFLAVDPPFNYAAGLRLRSELQARERETPSLTQRLVRTLSPLSVMRELVAIPCFTLSALRHLPRFDVCIGVGPWASLCALALRRLGRVRVVVYLDRDYDPGLLTDGLRRRLVGWMEDLGLRHADTGVSVGHRLSELRARTAGVTTTVIPNGIHWDDYAAAREAKRGAAGLLYIGHLADWSGVEEAIEAMPRILESIPQAHLDVVGSGLPEYERILESRVDELELRDRVRFHGNQPHHRLPEYLGRASVGLAASRPVDYRRFACPLKVMEYMASGLPAIVTRDTEAADIVERHGTGVAVACTATEIAGAVVRILGPEGEHARLRANALREGRRMDWRTLLEVEQSLFMPLLAGDDASR